MIEQIELYEGAYCDITDPGYHFIEKDGKEIIIISKFEIIDQVLQCEFQTHHPEYSMEDVQELVYIVLLKYFMNDYYLDKADYVNFVNKKTGEDCRIAYLG